LAEALQVKEDGSIAAQVTNDKGEKLSTLLRPDGSDTLKVVDPAHPGKEESIDFAANGDESRSIQFPDGSKVLLQYDGNPEDQTKPKLVRFDSNGGTLTFHKNDHGAIWTAKDPGGKFATGSLTAAEFQAETENLANRDKVSVEWFKVGKDGTRYEIVDDKSSFVDNMQRKLAHLKDIFT
jgi:hypothetical protein